MLCMCNSQHFELLPEPRLQRAQTSLLATITPELDALLDRAHAHLDKLARREQSLIAKSELQEGRLSSRRQSAGGGGFAVSEPAAAAAAAARAGGAGGRGEEGEVEGEKGREVLRLRQMRQKKERLSYAVERLNLQAQQRERQLRMSMAAQ